MIIGITGGSGCGKTTLLDILREKGAVMLDCDRIYHQLLQTDDSLLSAIERRFPNTVQNKGLNRKALGKLVFSDPEALADLNQITHTAVKKEVLRQLSSGPALAAIDAIALFESGLGELCDCTVAVLAPLEQRIRRLTARDGISEEYARLRVLSQHEDAWFREKCDYVLVNDVSWEDFHGKCLAFWESLSIMKENQ